MAIGPSGVQFGLWSHKWLTKSDDHKSDFLVRVRLQTELDGMMSRHHYHNCPITLSDYDFAD